MCDVIQKPKEFLFSHPEYEPTHIQISKLESSIKRRLNNEPIAYILGYKDFMDLRFEVNSQVLIPRPETEFLVEKAFEKIEEELRKNDQINIVDVGTGSGAIGISLYHLCNIRLTTIEFDRAHFILLDKHSKASETSKANADNLLEGHKIRFVESDLLDNIEIANNSVIIANLPYIPTNDYLNLESGVKNFEPRSALDGGDDGTDLILKLLEQISNSKKVGITILLEIDPSQVDIIKTKSHNLGFVNFESHKDLRGLGRYISITI